MERVELGDTITTFCGVHKTIQEITEERWHDMLEVLPPASWATADGVNSFYVIEALTGTIHSWFARVKTPTGERFFEVLEHYDAGNAKIAAKVRKALLNEASV